MANICEPTAVNPWSPITTYKTFKVGANVATEFQSVNNTVGKCGTNIDDICTALKSIKEKMGTNCGSSDEIDNIITNMGSKKEDLVKKNKELISACQQAVEYIYNNKSEKKEQAGQISNQLSQVTLYEG